MCYTDTREPYLDQVSAIFALLGNILQSLCKIASPFSSSDIGFKLEYILHLIGMENNYTIYQGGRWIVVRPNYSKCMEKFLQKN